MPKINRDNIYQHLLEKMFNIVDKTIQDAVLDKEWKSWTITQEEFNTFKKYSISIMQKVLKIPKKKAEGTFMWFWVTHGLIVKGK